MSTSKLSPQPQTAFTLGFKNFNPSFAPSTEKSIFVPLRKLNEFLSMYTATSSNLKIISSGPSSFTSVSYTHLRAHETLR